MLTDIPHLPLTGSDLSDAFSYNGECSKPYIQIDFNATKYDFVGYEHPSVPSGAPEEVWSC